MNIDKIFETSVNVIKDCSLKNGAIVASNIYDPDYPKGVKNYNYVWPRDASFVCVACDLIDLKKIPEKFFDWCWNAEKFKEKGIFYMRYSPDGKIYGRQFQPDQTGSLLWAMEHHSKYWDVNEFTDLIERAADGICSSWNDRCFKMSYDIWEERYASPQKGEKFTYSLAMCIKGLESAIKLIGPKAEWVKCKNQMKIEIESAYDKKLGYFVRKFNGKKDVIIDSSVLGIAWPSEIIKPNDFRMVSSVDEIIKSNTIENGGIMRYKGDLYAGFLRKKEGGAWPIINFWLSIYYSKLGNREKALKYFNWVVKRVEDKLPEQIKNGKPTSIIPLAWSHAMFITAGKSLNLF
jgi:GH15 family glucan-1,4-alpha-glucosidase